MEFRLTPIGLVHTCFKEKFGIPRQPNLVKEAPGTLVFYPEFAREEAVRALEGFSHIWIIFLFHKAFAKKGQAGKAPSWSPMVRPPRLGGNKKVGVFASRSPFRPNPVGMSCVALDRVEINERGPVLHLSGVDLLDQTPVVDIKPYLPYSDALAHARDGFAGGPPRTGLDVTFSDRALAYLEEKEHTIPNLRAVVTGVLENDPRPAYANGEDTDRIYGFRLFDLEIKWQVSGDRLRVISVRDATPGT